MKLLDENGFIESYNESRIRFSDYYKGRIDEKYYQSFHRMFSGEIIETERDNISSSGYVIDTLESALWCVANNNCYRDIVLSAVNLGGDTDTIAAVSGALAGIIFPDSIPTGWIKMLASKQLIDKVVDKFYLSL